MSDSMPKTGVPLLSPAEQAAFNAGLKVGAKNVESAAHSPLHEGYADGSVTLDLATWTGAVEKMLAEDRARHPVENSDRVEVKTAHPTETNPRFYSPTPKVQKPVGVPALVRAEEIPAKARIEEQEAHVALPILDLDVALYGLAHHLVAHARLRQAKQIALRPPRVDGDVVRFETVLVLG